LDALNKINRNELNPKWTIQMSIKIIKHQIDMFIGCDTPEVMAIKGDWGVGKTYSWRQFLKEAKESGNVSLDKYAYVSLFGINSLEAFKYAIFENTIDRDLIGDEASLKTLKQNTSSLLKTMGKKSLGLFGNSFLKAFTPAIESLSFLSLSQTLICIDDLERKGTGLDIKDVLGLISLLKERKKCKIVILLNDEEEGLDDYIKYREKVIDLELSFVPTAKECAAIAFKKEGYEYITLKELTQKLDIKNIRVLKKIERLVELAVPLLGEYEQEIKYQVVQSLVLFAWCYYGSNSDNKIPALEFVTNLGYSYLGIGEDKEENEDEKKWKSILLDYGYQLTDTFDLVLAESVRTGFFAEEYFKYEAGKKNNEIIASKAEGSFSDAWSLYHDSFDNNTDEVIDGLYESFKKNVKHISLTNLNGTVTLFRELDHDTKASEIIDIYIQQRKDESELFNLKENNFFGDIRDVEIVKKFDDIYEVSVTTENVTQVLGKISKKNGWSQGDEVVLANTTAIEYYNLFKSEKGKHLSSYVNTCLQFGKLSNATDQQKEIANRAIEALKRIASESEINRRRVRKFGIDLEKHRYSPKAK
jgi:hypothetical protein